MSTQVAIRNLNAIAALDSLSYGLVYSFLSTYILNLGGSHVSIGVLTIGNLVAELLSQDVTKIFTRLSGKRYALFFILNTSMVTHLMMVLTSSYWFTILVRILFSITNQSQSLCLKLLLNKAQNDETRLKLQRNYSILSGLGFILGPIISGYIFDFGFGYTGILAAFLAIVNVNILMKVTKDSKDADAEIIDKSALEKAAENVQELKTCDLKKHWDMLLLKYLFAASVIIFFSKFTQILKNNYNAGSITMGYTGAYINALVFAATYLFTGVKLQNEKYSLKFLMEVSFLLVAICMLLACYAPLYELYLFFLIPVILLRTLIMTFWKDLFAERKNESLAKLNKSVTVVAGLTVPLLFGFLCNQIAHNAVILFSCAPMYACWAILRWHSKFFKIDNGSTDEKKDS